MASPELIIRVDCSAVERELGVLAGTRLPAALTRGLAEAAEYAAGKVWPAAKAAGLRQPTGNLARSIGAWPGETAADGLTYYVGVPDEAPAARYAYLLTDAIFPIVPRGHPFLAIPVGAGLNPGGAARYSSPRQVPELSFHPGGEALAEWAEGGVFHGLVAGVMSGGRFEALFALVRAVTARGFDVLEPTVSGAAGEMTALVQAQVDALL